MRGLNKVMIIGTLGKDPEMRFTSAGVACVNLNVATNEKWKDKDTGEMKESTEWHRIVMFGKVAEISNEYLKKGSHAYFEGKIQTRKWVDKEGKDRYSMEILVKEMQMLGGQADTDNRGDYDRDKAPQEKPAEKETAAAPADDGFDDIPF